MADIQEPPSLSAMLERAPSLTHSTTTDTTEDQNNLETLLTPVDAPVLAEMEKSKGRLKAGMSKSMGNLKKGKEGNRGRAMSGGSADKADFSIPPIPLLVARPPPPPSARPPIRPPARQGSGFSSFIRKLTGRSLSPPKAQPANPPAAPRSKTPQPMRPSQANPAIRIDTRPSHPQRAPTAIAVARPAEVAPILPRETDPLKIPLPPSPTLLPADLAPPALVPSEPPIKRVKTAALLSLDGVGEMEQLSSESENEDEDDVFEELKPLAVRIPTRSTGASSDIVTPSSVGSSGSTGSVSGARYAGSSPPRKAPVGSAPVDLGRTGSKWRKSVMGLSDTLNSTLPRKQSTRQPPSSYDAYQAQQRRIAASRQSCAPTLHSTASIAAELREIKDKEEADLAEQFFLS